MAFYTDFPLYPTSVFDDNNFPSQNDDTSWVYAALINALKEELQAALTELGTLPKGTYADVKTRLDATVFTKGIMIITSTRVLTDAAGNVAYTGVGFTPKLLLAMANVTATSAVTWGFAAGTGAQSQGLAILSTGKTAYPVNNIICIHTGVGKDQTATLLSFDADGFTLTWTKTGAPTGTGNLLFLCIG